MPDKKLLFSEKDLSAIVRERVDFRIPHAVEQLPEEAFANADKVLADLVAQFSIPRLELEPDRVEVSTNSAQVDVSDEWFVRGADQGQRIRVPGTRVSYHVPFRGDYGLFDCRGNTYTMNPPQARFTEHELIFDYDVPADQSPGETKKRYDHDLGTVLQWTGWVNELVDGYTTALPDHVRRAFASRMQRLTRAKDELVALGIPIRKATAAASKAPDPAPKQAPPKRPSPKIRDYDVALSFAGEDRPYVDRVANALEEKNLSFFYDDREQVELWGRDLGPHLAEIYGKRARFVVIFISKHYAEKVWTRWEWKNALAGAITTKTDRVLPARFDDTELDGLLPTIGHVDLQKLTPEKLAELINAKLRSAG